MGYHEQSHRRGPASRFAHWTLKGIDAAVRRIYRDAQRSAVRDYDVWIYADHGQEETVPYHRLQGRSVSEAIDTVLQSPTSHQAPAEQCLRLGFCTRLALSRGGEPGSARASIRRDGGGDSLGALRAYLPGPPLAGRPRYPG